MAKAKLDILLDDLNGRLKGSSEFYVTNRYGKTVISNYPLHRDPKKISAKQHANSSTFGQLSTQAKLEMSDPARLAYWQERYDAYTKTANKNLPKANAQFFNIDPITTPPSKQKYYQTLRGFIIAQLSLQTKDEKLAHLLYKQKT